MVLDFFLVYVRRSILSFYVSLPSTDEVAEERQENKVLYFKFARLSAKLSRLAALKFDSKSLYENLVFVKADWDFSNSSYRNRSFQQILWIFK